jgi:hypothetical protein
MIIALLKARKRSQFGVDGLEKKERSSSRDRNLLTGPSKT